MAQSLREKYINTIMKSRCDDDSQDEMEDEFDLDGEIRDIDFDENELY